MTVMCEVLEVSRSGYYAWQQRPESARSVRRRELVAEMRAIHEEKHKDNYGSPRMLQELRARGRAVCENTVAKLMQENALRAATARKFRHTTDSNHSHPVAENVLNQEFGQPAANTVWVSDITYITTREGWLYPSSPLKKSCFVHPAANRRRDAARVGELSAGVGIS